MPYISGGGSGGGGAISGVTVTGTGAAGLVPIATSSSAGAWTFPPGHEFGYDQITSSVNIVGTTEAAPTTIITCAAHVFDGGPVLAEFYCSQIVFDTAVANDTLGISLWEGASELGILAFMRAGTTGQPMLATTLCCRFTPTAASHTYLIRAWATSATGTPSISAGAGGVGTNFPAFARFIKAS